MTQRLEEPFITWVQIDSSSRLPALPFPGAPSALWAPRIDRTGQASAPREYAGQAGQANSRDLASLDERTGSRFARRTPGLPGVGREVNDVQAAVVEELFR